jgi:acyl carrier protein
MRECNEKERMMQQRVLDSADLVRQGVRKFIVENFFFGDVEKSFSDVDSFIKKGIMDSTGILELIEFLEQSFDIKIDEKETLPENLDSVDRVVGFVQRKIAG